MLGIHGNDQSDIEVMIDRALVAHAELPDRFRTAVDAFKGNVHAEELLRYVRNLHRVDRDLFAAAE